MSLRELPSRDRLRLGNALVILLLAIVLGVRAFERPSVPLFLMSGAFAAYAIVRLAAFRKALRAGR